ncbi:transposon Tf2-9 polyprotein [Trichonephila clavipes]|nr:transposon Tf2-9 polyprotein [Trichonephila clavipes]
MQTELIKLAHEKGHFSSAKTEEIITTGVHRGNGQVERIHRTLIPVLTKLSIDDPTKWYKFVDRLQRILNSTSNRSTKWSPFELLTGVSMRNREDLYLRNLLMEEMVEELQEQRNQLRQDAKRNIQKIQAENKRTYDRERKRAPRANYSTLCQITGVSDFRMAELVGKLYSLRFRIIRIFFNFQCTSRERYVGDGGLKRTELNLEANRGIRASDVKRMRHLNAQSGIRAMTSSAYNP